MWAKTSISGRLGRIVFLGVWLLITIFPLYWIINTSFKTPGSIFSQPLHYYPDQFTFDNFIGILQDGAYGNFTVYFLNSVLIATVAAALTTVIALFSGYTLARFQFRTHGAVLLGFLVTQMLPGFIALGPLFQMMTNLGMTDSKYGLTLLYFAGAIPFSTIMLRAFFENTPPRSKKLHSLTAAHASVLYSVS